MIKGVTRWVFPLKRWVIKIPSLYSYKHFITGLYCNISEKETWDITHSEWLCPTTFSFLGFINIQKKVKICTTYEEIDHYLEKDDHKPCQYGYDEKEHLVCVDYPYHKIGSFLRK